MSVDHVFDKSVAIWKSFADGAADVIEYAGERIEYHKPTIVAVANAMTGAYLGYRFAGKEPTQFWGHMFANAPRNFVAIRGSQMLMDYAEERLDKEYGYKLPYLSRHNGVWISSTALNALLQLEQLQGNPQRQQNFARTSQAMRFISALPDEGIDLVTNILHGASREIRRSSR